VRLLPLPHLLIFSLLIAIGPSEARAAHAVPPVPQKQGPGPPEGFSRDRLIVPPPGREGEGSRAPLGAKATFNVLAIRVAFSDTPIDSSAAYFNRLLFFQKQYWEQQTEGVVTIVPTLADSVFTLPHPMAYYGDDDRFQERLVFMVRDLVQLADSTIDFRPYQSLVIFHAGHGQEADVRDDSRDQIWSAFVTKEDFKTILPDSTGAVGIRTNDPVGPGFAYVSEAVELPELESQDDYSFGMTGVVCHEFGHQLGLPDLYDTNGAEGGASQGVGSWDVMGTGVWNGNGFVPAGLSAWSKMFLGVLAPQRLVTPQAVSLSMLERQVEALPRAVQIPMTATEYLLLENRLKDLNGDGEFDFDDVAGNRDEFGNLIFDFYVDSYAGAEFDYYLPGSGREALVASADTVRQGSGMLVYHVDETVIAAGLADNVINASSARKGLDVVEADGIEDMDGPLTSFSEGSPDDVFRAGWRDRLTPDTTPSTAAYGNVRTGISITGISAADSIMSFALGFERDKPGWPKILTGRVRSAPSLAADIDGAGPPFTRELLVPVQRLNNTGALYVFRPDGTDFLDGDATPTPFATSNSGLVTSPCVGDVDGVAGNEVVFATANGTIYAFHANGTEVVDGDANPLTSGVVVAGSALGIRAQPVLGEVDGLPGLEIVIGAPVNTLGFSLLRVIKVSGGVVQSRSMTVGGGSEAPPVVADLDGDGVNEVIAAARAGITADAEYTAPGLYYTSWEVLNDPILPLIDPEGIGAFRIVAGGPFSSPVAADLDRDGQPEVVVAGTDGLFHAYRFTIATHIAGDPPVAYVSTSELPGWPAPFPGAAEGSTAEIAVADLEGDGHPEVFQTGDDARVAAIYWSGAPRSGYPVKAGTPLAPADSSGVWSPFVADVDGDGQKDVIAVLPDGRRPAYRGDGSLITGFAELGSTGLGAPPILADLEGDGPAEWIETFDATSTAETQISVKTPSLAVDGATIAWGQYRLHPTRNAVVVPGGPVVAGTRGLSELYVYPNPSRDGTSRIHYRLDAAATSVSIRIYDASGALVADLPAAAADLLGSSEHAVVWNHRSISSGIYLCRVEVHSGGQSEVRFTRLAVLR
jgi:M6 family metalloprotease-like protein